MIDLSFDLFGDQGPLLVVAPAVALLGAWVWAEVRGRLMHRLIFAASLMSMLIYIGYYVGWLGPQYTITYYDAAIRRSAETLERGEPAIVEKAFAEYLRRGDQSPITILAELEAQQTEAP
jgi:hypothetical protein